MPDLLEEPFDRLLRRLAPGIETERVGATEDDIERIQEIAGQELPSFYRWFLTTMGRNMGRLSRSFRNFTAPSVLAAYREGGIEPDPPYLLIGRYPDPLMPADFYYDLSRPVRDDAMVVSRPANGGVERNISETFREHLAWAALGMFAVDEAPQRALGLFDDLEGDVKGQLTEVMRALGYASPIETGAFCALFEGHGMTMTCSATPDPEDSDALVFLVGAQDTGSLRRLLGEIGTRTRLQVLVHKWTPALSES